MSRKKATHVVVTLRNEGVVSQLKNYKETTEGDDVPPNWSYEVKNNIVRKWDVMREQFNLKKREILLIYEL